LSIDLKKMLLVSLIAANNASRSILDLYNTPFKVRFKNDNSPLTLADKNSHKIIENILKNYFPKIPILSEEGKNIPYSVRKDWEYLWLIDPLDGTKEFVRKNGEFTVNIALIHGTRPVLGIIDVPVRDIVYFAGDNLGAYRLENKNKIIQEIVNELTLREHTNYEEKFIELISCSKKLPLNNKEYKPGGVINVIVSRSHMNRKTEEFLEELSKNYKFINRINVGSSLKLCIIAEGSADIYPRFAPTMEWDIAAGQCIVEEAGGRVINYESSEPLKYNKKSLVNLWFVIKGIE